MGIKVFEKEFDSFNVVDTNNVFVGFDFMQDCCEGFGYAFTDKLDKEANPMETECIKDSFDHSKYVFDTSFFVDFSGQWYDDDDGCVAFRLVAEGEKDIYLVLYNSHNGYYHHGFEMKQGDKVIYDGYI